MIKGEVPTGFGNVRNRCNFLLRHPNGKSIECIKVNEDKAIFMHPNRSVTRSMRTITMVLTDQDCLRN